MDHRRQRARRTSTPEPSRGARTRAPVDQRPLARRAPQLDARRADRRARSSAGFARARDAARRRRQARRRHLVRARLLRALLARFDADPTLGIASGTCYELEATASGGSATSPATASGARRAPTAGRASQEVLPLEERMGWDGVDEFKANARGWTTRRSSDLPFRHHRREGERDGRRRRRGRRRGARPTTSATACGTSSSARSRARSEPAALAMLWGYGPKQQSAGAPRSADPDVRAHCAARGRSRGCPAARARGDRALTPTRRTTLSGAGSSRA